MDSKRYKIIKNTVIEALELQPDQIAQYLDDACHDDVAMRKEVEELLNQAVGDAFLADSPVALEFPNPEAETLEGNIGRIHIEHLLARGGMGDVYAGTDQLLGRPVAIKIISNQQRFSQARQLAFLTEAKLLSSLHHPNICQVYDYFEDQDRGVLVLELIEGKTLRQCLQKNEKIDINKVLNQSALALMVAHERGIGHYDLKPENIMITQEGQIKILDFGLARSEHDKAQQADVFISGTPQYMAPEQAKGVQLSNASDIYTLALIFIELWTGKPATNNKESSATVNGIDPVLLTEIDPLPHAEKQLLIGMLHTEAEQRFTAREVFNRLQGINERPKRRLKYAASFSLILIFLFIGWKYAHDLSQERNSAIEAKESALQARNDAENLIGFMLDDLQIELRAVGKLDLLATVAEQVINYYDNPDLAVMIATRGRPAMALAQAGEVLDFQGEKAKAIEVLNKAISALSTLHSAMPEDELIAYRLATTQAQLGENYKLNGQFDDSEAVLVQAIATGKSLTSGLSPGKGPAELPNGFQRWKLLLNAQYLYADIFMRKGDGLLAVEILESIVDESRLAASVEPQLLPHLADIEYKRCDTYYDIPIKDKVLAPCLATLEMDKKLFEANQENYHLHSNYALDLAVMARVYALLGQPDTALSHINQSLQHLDQLHQWDPDNAQKTNDLVSTLLAKAKILKQLDQEQNSHTVLLQAEALLTPLFTDKKEITVRNNMFAIKVLLGKLDEARPIGKVLHEMGFRRREFAELCQQFNIQTCLKPVIE